MDREKSGGGEQSAKVIPFKKSEETVAREKAEGQELAALRDEVLRAAKTGETEPFTTALIKFNAALTGEAGDEIFTQRSYEWANKVKEFTVTIKTKLKLLQEGRDRKGERINLEITLGDEESILEIMVEPFKNRDGEVKCNGHVISLRMSELVKRKVALMAKRFDSST